MQGSMIVFFCFWLHCMIVRVVWCAIIRLITAFPLIVNPRITRISHLIDTHNQNQSYETIHITLHRTLCIAVLHVLLMKALGLKIVDFLLCM